MKNEATTSDEHTLYAASIGGVLWRNNSGVLNNKHGTPVRYGLGNVSQRINKVRKSSDQVGILPVVVTPDMVGKTVGVFIAVEDKHEGWEYTGSEHEEAQQNFIKHVNRLGGIATFAQSVNDIRSTILDFHRRFTE